MSEDKELDAWKSEWQSLGGREGLAEELAHRVANDGRRIRRGIATEIAAGAVAALIGVWLVVRTRGELVATVACAGILVFTGVWITRLVTLREGAMVPASNGLDDFIELTRRRVRDDLRWSHFTLRAMQVLALLLVPWAVWAFIARYAMYRAEPWRALVGFGGAALILVLSLVWQRHKRRKVEVERDRFESLVAERTLV